MTVLAAHRLCRKRPAKDVLGSPAPAPARLAAVSARPRSAAGSSGEPACRARRRVAGSSASGVARRVAGPPVPSLHAPPPVMPAISRPISSRGVSGETIARIRPRYITAIRSASADHLVQLAGDHQHGGADVPLVHDPAVDELDRADVHAAGGLGGDEELERPGHLPGHDDLLLVAAGERADRRPRATRCGCRTARSAPWPTSAIASGLSTNRVAERRPVVDVEHQVLGDGELLDQPVDAAVLGHVADAGAQDLLGRHAGDRAGRRA